MNQKYIDMIESLCDDVRNHPDSADKYLRLIAAICKLNLIKLIDVKREFVKIIIKVLIYALTLLGAYFGVTSMSSCSSSQIATHKGYGIFQYVDTFRTSGKSTLNY